ncbi:MAG: hypothetical protein HKN02_09500 [Rhodobacteraceae bacterium]|nr:hypothetical protein [Paracoccaceae bacterium]
MKHFEIKQGDWPTFSGVPPAQIEEAPRPNSVALLGSDSPGLRPRFELAEGDRVAPGQVVFRDRARAEIAFVSPVAGVVSDIAYGPRKTLSACIVTTDDSAPGDAGGSAPGDDDPAAIRATLLERGFWPAFRTRPFGRMPAPADRPDAIFVNTAQTGPQAPDPRLILAPQTEAFHHGVTVLTRLTEGEVFVCQPPGAPLGPQNDRIRHASFSGSRAAGLASTHIDRLFPIRLGRRVWTIDVQDVAAIGHLFLTGRFHADRVISVTGPGSDQTRLIRTSPGAKIADICGPLDGPALSGDATSGKRAAFLGRFDTQITLLPPAKPTKRTWFRHAAKATHAAIPTAALDTALALDILAVPMLRALSLGDSEMAERLGCLALVEEDVATLTRRCTSGADYGALLRGVLNDLERDAP